MEPTVLPIPGPPPAVGSPLGRAARALLVEHRLPGPAARAWDRLAHAAGLRYKTLRVGGRAVTVRRRGDDWKFVRSVLELREYNPPGYEIGAADTVVDVGANIGAFALLAAGLARRGRVVAVEPVAENFALLQRNLARNRAANVAAVRAAVLDRPGTVPIHLHGRSSGRHSLFGDRWTDGPPVGVEQVPRADPARAVRATPSTAATC